MAKVQSKSEPGWAKGGPTGQVGKTSGPARSVGQQKAGVSSQEGSGSGKYATGGSSHMAGHSGAGKATPGKTSNPMNGGTFSPKSGGFAQGGPAGGMAPQRGSQPAQPGKSSAY